MEKEVDMLELENTQIHLLNRLNESERLQLSRQIQPHFMFNTFNVFLSLARLNRQKELIKGLENFSSYLRYKYTDKKALIPLSIELEQTEKYIGIQKIRFGKRLFVQFNVDHSILGAAIPPYTVQILVENAFKHALDEKKGEKKLSINISRTGNWIELIVKDNGQKPLAKSISSGIGLQNIRKRLSLLFDLYTDATVRRTAQNETEAVIIWPYTIFAE